MSKERFKTAISLENTKEAAVYFDHVVPLGLVINIIDERSRKRQFPGIQYLKSELLPPSLKRSEIFDDLFTKSQGGLAAFFIASFKERDVLKNLPPHISEILDKGGKEDFLNFAGEQTKKLVKKFSLTRLPIADAGLQEHSSLQKGAPEDFSLALQRVNLVDVRNTEWNQIFEFRKDLVAQTKLRRLRLFAFDNYDGKPVSFIEDDICKRKEDYEGVVAKWGFETREGAVNSIVNSKVLASGGVAAVATAAMGMPLPAILSTLATGGVELTKLGFYISKRRFELRQFVKENPFSFFEYANSKLVPPPKDLRKK